MPDMITTTRVDAVTIIDKSCSVGEGLIVQFDTLALRGREIIVLASVR